MIKSITTTATVLSLISSVLAAGQMLGTPEVWECDAPGTEGFFISENEVHFEHAAAACASSGGILADITNQNFLFATDMILNCVGENENAWIRYVYIMMNHMKSLLIFVKLLGLQSNQSSSA